MAPSSLDHEHILRFLSSQPYSAVGSKQRSYALARYIADKILASESATTG